MIGQAGPAEWFESGCPPQGFAKPVPPECEITVVDDVRDVHDFTYVSQYEGVDELATIVGRIYGPRCAHYTTRAAATLVRRHGTSPTGRGRHPNL